jgi:hypothetical protein
LNDAIAAVSVVVGVMLLGEAVTLVVAVTIS